MTRARPKENRAASAWPDLRSGVRSRHFASGLNQPDSSEPPPMAIGFFGYLRERGSSLHPRPISKMPQSFPLATSVESNALHGWKTNRRSWFSRQTINAVACRPRLFQRFPIRAVLRRIAPLRSKVFWTVENNRERILARARLERGGQPQPDCLELLVQASVDESAGRVVNGPREVIERERVRWIMVENVVDAERDRRLIE